MRKLAWLTLIAAAVLFFGGPEYAFAHSSHHHVQQAQTHSQHATASGIEHAVLSSEIERDGEFVSVSAPLDEQCPHGQDADCASCCACAGGASVALVTPEVQGRAVQAHSEPAWRSVAFEVRQAVLDLSRPPKSFA